MLNKFWLLTGFSTLVLLFALADDVHSCRVKYIRTASEITEVADLIIHVKVPDEKVKEVSPIEMQILEVIKGDHAGDTISIEGQTLEAVLSPMIT